MCRVKIVISKCALKAIFYFLFYHYFILDFSDKKDSQPPGKYLWSELFKSLPQALIYFLTSSILPPAPPLSYQNVRLKVAPSSSERNGNDTVLTYGDVPFSSNFNNLLINWDRYVFHQEKWSFELIGNCMHSTEVFALGKALCQTTDETIQQFGKIVSFRHSSANMYEVQAHSFSE